MSSLKPRLTKELRDIISNPPNGITAGLKGNVLTEWVATLMGPAGTPYEGGLFILDIKFPNDYPYVPPIITFKTPIYHCNINKKGDICLDILKNNWSPALMIDKVLLSISSLLAAPNPSDPFVGSIAQLLESNKEEHDRQAREYTMAHAINK